MSINLTGLRFTSKFKHNLRHLSKKYRKIGSDLQPIYSKTEQIDIKSDIVRQIKNFDSEEK